MTKLTTLVRALLAWIRGQFPSDEELDLSYDARRDLNKKLAAIAKRRQQQGL